MAASPEVPAPAPLASDIISPKEHAAVNLALDQGPKSMLILLTHSQANKLKRFVRNKRRVEILKVDRHLSLVMWSGIATDAEAIRRALNATSGWHLTNPVTLVVLLAIVAFSTALGATSLWYTLAYGASDNSLLARAETWVTEIAAHIAKGCSIITIIIGFFRSLIVGVYSGFLHVLCMAMGKSEVLWRSIRATIAYFKGFFLRTSSRAWHITLRGFHITLERTINYLQHLLARIIAAEASSPSNSPAPIPL